MHGGDAMGEALEIEEIVEAAAPGFYGDRKVLESADRLEESAGAAPGHPQRHSPVETGLRKQKRAAGVLAKAPAEEARGLETAAQGANHVSWRLRQHGEGLCHELRCRVRRWPHCLGATGRRAAAAAAAAAAAGIALIPDEPRKLHENGVVLRRGGDPSPRELLECRGQKNGQRIVLRATPEGVTDDASGRKALVLHNVLEDDAPAVRQADTGMGALRNEESGKLSGGGG